MNTPGAQWLLEFALRHLWQATVLVGCTWVALRVLRRWSAESRYWLWCTALLLVAAMPFLGQLPLWQPPALAQLPDLVVASTPAPVADIVARPATLLAAAAPVRPWLPSALVGLWAAGLLWRLVSLARSAATLRRWVREARPIPSGSLPVPAAVARRIPVLESAHVSVPMVSGCLRPCILLPVGLRSRLPRSQLALVLRHELAHIERGDVWMLLLQRLIEAVYFYNPLVFVVTRAMSRERECSCDDRAVRSTGGAHDAAGIGGIDYADCLVEIARQGSRRRSTALAVGAIRGSSELTLRVERLLNRTDLEDTTMYKLPVALAAGALLLTAMVVSQAVPDADAAIIVGHDDSHVDQDAPVGSSTGRALVRGLAEDGISVDAARALIDAGADVNHILPGDGTPLILAARSGDVELARLLLQHGAEVDRFSPGDGNPLIAAAANGHLATAVLLLDSGASIDAQDPNDETPLINAARSGHLPVVELLISKGADVNLAVQANTLHGTELRTPLGEARKAGHRSIVDRLQQAGATH